MSKLQERKGITLVSLVVTIIILLILSAVAINLAVNTDGLFGKAGEASNKWNTAIGQEETDINDMLNKMEEFSPTLKPMVTKWNVAAGDTIEIYLYMPFTIDFDEDGNYVFKELSDNTDVTIDWGDGTVERYTSDNLIYSRGLGSAVHTYEEANSNTTVTINGKCNTIFVPGIWGINQLTAIEQWGYTETANYLFPECTNLASIASPEKNTFKNVTSFIVDAPMFYGCTSLTSIPDNMFANCSNIPSKGFIGVFEGCTGITSIGDYAFANCTSVTSFDGMFADCTNLTSIGSHTFEGCTNVTSFAGTFAGCTGITGIGDYAFANCSSVTDFDGTFYGCTNLTSIGAHAFDGCSSVTSFANLFKEPTSLGTKMNDMYTVEKCIVIAKEYEVMPVYMGPQGYNTNITSIGEYAFANCSSVTSFYEAFAECTNLTSIGEYAFANCTSVTVFKSTFYGCTSLTSIPSNLFANCPNVTDFSYTFFNCTSLTGNAIPLWERVPTPTGTECYYNCTGLANYADIPDDWKLGK